MQAEIQHYLAIYGYAALLPLAIIEGPAVTVFAAFLAAQGVFDVVGVYAIVVLGDLVGDVLHYAVGRWAAARWAAKPRAAKPMAADLVASGWGAAGRRATGRWPTQPKSGRTSRWMASVRQRVEVLAPRIRTRAGAMLLFGKWTHSAGFAVLLAAGAAHVKLRRFLAFNLLGTLPKSLLLVLLGYWFGKLYGSLQGDLRIAGVLAFLLAGSGLLLAARYMLNAPDEREA
jgi:membrane protein DedA with SNARE-associated domain